MSKGKKGKLRSIHAHIEPMKDSKGNQGYKVHVSPHFEPDGDEGKQGPMPTSSEPEPTFATSRKQAIGHIVKHANAAMAMHEGGGMDADGDYDGDEPKVPAGHPLKKLRRGY